MAQLVAALKGRLLIASPRVTTTCLTKSAFGSARAYSRKAKTKYEVEAAELRYDIEKLHKAIAEQERMLAAKKAYQESIARQNERIEAASTVYRELMKPLPSPPSASSTGAGSATAATARLAGNPNAKSFLPGTFLEDLKLTFLDTRGAKEEKLRQLQSGLLSMEDLKAISPNAVQQQSPSSAPSATLATGTDNDGVQLSNVATVPAEVETKVEDAVVFERVRALDVSQWNQLVYVNALEGRPDKAEQVLKLMEEVGVSPNLETFDYLLEAYANHGDLTKARATIDLIIKNGLTPSLSAFKSLVQAHVNKRDVKGAFGAFEALKQYHVPDTAVWTQLIKGCLVGGEYELGWKVFDQMQHSGAPPDEGTYSLMIHACAKTDQVEKALDIFRQYPTRDLHPTDKTFNSLIHACAVRKEYYTTAFALLNEMQSVYGFEPDVLTYNTLLFACSKRQDLMTARRIFQKVVQLDSEGALQMDSVTVTNFLWCVTEWKSTDVHQKQYKRRLYMERQQKLLEQQQQHEPLQGGQAAMTHPSTPTDTTTTLTTTATSMETNNTLAIRPDYLLLSKIPPVDETEALAEGEMVFSWYVARAAERHPPKAAREQQQHHNSQVEAPSDPSAETLVHAAPPSTPPQEPQSQSQSEQLQQQQLDIQPALPEIGRHHAIRTRLLNAYLAMYVRHNQVERSKDIYRRYFEHFHQTRDSWTFATMLEGCYFWKDVEFGSDVFRDWRAWRKSTGKVTERRYRQADYQVYRRTVNLLARTNHLHEALGLLEELANAATALPETAAAAGDAGDDSAATSAVGDGHDDSDDRQQGPEDGVHGLAQADKELDELFSTSVASLKGSSASTPSSSSSSSTSTTTTSLSTIDPSKFSFLSHTIDEPVLPIYPRLQDFPAVYTKTWELEDEPARRYLLSLCSGGVETLNAHRQEGREKEGGDSTGKEKRSSRSSSVSSTTTTAAREAEGKRRHDKSLRKLARKWKGEHHHPDDRRGSGGGLYIGERRRRELEQDASKRGWGRK